MSKTMRILKQTVKNTAGFKTSLLFTRVAFFYLHFTLVVIVRLQSPTPRPATQSPNLKTKRLIYALLEL